MDSCIVLWTLTWFRNYKIIDVSPIFSHVMLVARYAVLACFPDNPVSCNNYDLLTWFSENRYNINTRLHNQRQCIATIQGCVMQQYRVGQIILSLFELLLLMLGTGDDTRREGMVWRGDKWTQTSINKFRLTRHFTRISCCIIISNLKWHVLCATPIAARHVPI